MWKTKEISTGRTVSKVITVKSAPAAWGTVRRVAEKISIPSPIKVVISVWPTAISVTSHKDQLLSISIYVSLE